MWNSNLDALTPIVDAADKKAVVLLRKQVWPEGRFKYL